MSKCYFVVCEISGDLIGGAIVRSIVSAYPYTQILGVLGPEMLKECPNSKTLFDVTEMSTGGIIELIPSLLKIKQLMKKTIDDILEKKPDVLVTIDSPDFCYSIAKAVKGMIDGLKIIHIVAPSVWAWRPNRAGLFAKIYDHILTLFDFEPQYFEKFGLKATFIGHPCVETIPQSNDPAKRNDKIILMPGSRKQEIKSLLPIFVEAVKKANVIERTVIATFPHLLGLVTKHAPTIHVETRKREKMELMQTSQLAIVASGTATLELALCGCPMIVAYKMSSVSYCVIHEFIKIKYISLVNILLEKEVIPELIQRKCNIQNMIDLIKNPDCLNEQVEHFQSLRSKLRNENQQPSLLAAKIILSYLNR